MDSTVATNYNIPDNGPIYTPPSLNQSMDAGIKGFNIPAITPPSPMPQPQIPPGQPIGPNGAPVTDTPERTFADLYNEARQKKGADLTPGEVQNLADSYKYNEMIPHMQQRGLPPAKAKWELKLYDDGIAQIIAGLSAKPKTQQDASASNFLPAAGKSFGYGLGSDILSAPVHALGAPISVAEGIGNKEATLLNNVFGTHLDENRHTISNLLYNLTLNPNTAKSVQDRVKQTMGSHYGDPNYATLQAHLTDNLASGIDRKSTGAAGNINTPAEAGADIYGPGKVSPAIAAQQGEAEAYRENPYGATVGGLGKFLTELAILKRAGLPNVPSALALGGSQGVQQGQQRVQTSKEAPNAYGFDPQTAADTSLQSAFNLLPGHIGSANKIVRGASGAGIGLVESVIQHLADYGINPQDNPNIVPDSREAGTQAALQAALAMFHGGPKGGGKPLKKSSTETEQPANTATPPADGNAATPTAPAPAGAALVNAPEVGMQDEAYQKLHDDTLNELAKKAGTNKIKQIAIKGNPSAIENIARAENYAQSQLGDQWSVLSLPQRLDLVEKIAAKFNSIKPKEGHDDAVAAYKQAATQATTSATPQTAPANPGPTGGEQPTPPIEGAQQVPGTAPSEPASPPAAQGAAPVAPTAGEALSGFVGGIAHGMYVGLYNTLLGKSKAFIGDPLYNQAKPEFDKGNIKSVDDLKAFLQKVNQESTAQTVASALKESGDTQQQGDKLRAAVKRKLQEKQQAARAAEPPAQVAPTRSNAESIYLDNYLKAILNHGPSSGPTEEAIRADPRFNAARQAQQRGFINSPDTLAEFLQREAAKTPKETPATPPGPQDNIMLSKVISGKSIKAENVQARAEANKIKDALLRLGESPKDINTMTLGDARKLLTKHLESAVKPETPEPKPSKNNLKKVATKPASTLEQTSKDNTATIARAKSDAEAAARDTLVNQYGMDKAEVDKIPVENLPDAIRTMHEAQEKTKATVQQMDALKKQIAEARARAGVPQEHGGKLTLKKKETTPPKQVAPENLSGAEKGSKEEPTASQATKQERPALGLSDRVRVLTKGVELTPHQLEDLTNSVELAQQGDHSELHDTLEQLGDTLSKEQVKQIRKLANEQYKAPEKVLRETVDKLVAEAKDAEENPDEQLSAKDKKLQEVAENLQLRLHAEEKDGEQFRLEEGQPPLDVRRRIDKVIDAVRKGDIDHAEALEEFKKLSDEVAERTKQRNFKEWSTPTTRGPDWVKERLLRLRRQGGPSASVDFALWLLDKNPNLANNLAISIRKLPEGKAGSYIPDRELMTLATSGRNPRTIVHEIMHHAERMLPQSIQDKIREEYWSRLLNKYKQATRNNDEAGKAFLEDVMRNIAYPTKESRNAMLSHILSGAVDVDSYYKYTDPSEYWAEEASRILKGKQEATGWASQAREWLKEFIEHAKNFLGLSNTSAVYKGLNDILSGEGDFNSEQQIAGRRNIQFDATHDPNMEEEKAALKAKPVKTQPTGSVTNLQRVWERLSLKTFGLEKAEQAATRAGVELNEDNKVFDNAYGYEGLKDSFNKMDMARHFEPVAAWVEANYAKFGDSKQKFLDNINKFFQNRNTQERIHTAWLHEVKLEGGAEVQRVDVMEDFREHKITPAQAESRLEAIARKHASQTEDEFAVDGGFDPEQIRKNLTDLKKTGLDDKSIEPLNKLMDGARDQATQRLINAGKLAPDDIRLKELYNWKYYVPLKGSLVSAKPGDNFDLIPEPRMNLSRLNQQIKVMEGRTSEAERPFNRLFVDMKRAGEREANSKLTNSVYELVNDSNDKLRPLKKQLKDINDKLKAAKITKEAYDKATETINKQIEELYHTTGKIDVWEGNLANGYKNSKTGQEVDSLSKVAKDNTIIHNDGDTHYLIHLNTNSQLLRGLKMMNNEVVPPEWVKKVGGTTNVLARLYTTLSPAWATGVQFVRTISYVPMMTAITKYDGPFDATKFFAGYGKNLVESVGALKQIPTQVLGQHLKLEQMAKDNPNSWAAWTVRYQTAGGELGHVLQFNAGGLDRLFNSKISDARPGAKGLIDLTRIGWNNLTKYTGNYISALDLMTRTAGFKTLVESGMSDKEATVTIRKTLDYSQTGTWGRTINSLIAFSRVGATSADAARRAFTKPTGGIDYVKYAKWQAFFGALSYIAYNFLNMALGKDDDGKDKISKLTPDTLTQKLPFPLPDGQIGGINLGLGLPQIMLAPGMLAAAVANGHMKPEEASTAYLETLGRNGPIHPAGSKGDTPASFLASVVKGFIPTLARPVVDDADNVDQFGSPIHTEHPNDKIPRSEQARGSTPEEFTTMARWLYDATDGKADYYPEDIRYMIMNYGGQWTSDIIKGTWAKANSESQGREVSPFPGVDSHLLISDANFYQTRELYRTMDSLGEAKQRYNMLISRAISDGVTQEQATAQANQAANADPDFKQKLTAFNTLDKAALEYNKRIKALRQDKLMSTERKALLRKQYDTQLRSYIDKFEPLTQ